jgi:DNA-binding transcriptional LysR family regulator
MTSPLPPPLDWELCRSFLAVLREGNLSRAALALQLTQPTLGRHIDELEKALGVALFTRSPQGLKPTAEALQLRTHVQAMAASAEALVRAASGGSQEARGTVRVTVPELVGTELMPAILTSFRAKHPAIAIELVLTNATENLLEREADVAVRLVPPAQDALLARKIGEVRFGFYAHRDYIARHGMPRSLAELRDHTLIGFDKAPTGIRVLRNTPSPISREAYALRSDSPVAQIAMGRAGFGIGGNADFIARKDTNLVPVLPEAYGMQTEMWVVMHEDQRGVHRARLMFDHLAAALGKLVGPGAKRKGKPNS